MLLPINKAQRLHCTRAARRGGGREQRRALRHYTDTTPLPATPAKWKYRAIYRVGDAQVGLWSLEAGVVVGG